MANKNTTLTGLFTNIADAIREKTGGTESIVADNFPEAIAAIDTQEDLDPELATQDDLIAKIAVALEGKTGASGGGSAIDTCSIDFSMEVMGSTLISIIATIIDDNGTISWYGTSLGKNLGRNITINNIIKNSPVIIAKNSDFLFGTSIVSNLICLADPAAADNIIVSSCAIFKADNGYVAFIEDDAS